jgi:hypothetical protein
VARPVVWLCDDFVSWVRILCICGVICALWLSGCGIGVGEVGFWCLHSEGLFILSCFFTVWVPYHTTDTGLWFIGIGFSSLFLVTLGQHYRERWPD